MRPNAQDTAERKDEASDSTRRFGSVEAGQSSRLAAVKPDPETNPLADLDGERVPTWDEHMPQATPLRASTCE